MSAEFAPTRQATIDAADLLDRVICGAEDGDFQIGDEAVDHLREAHEALSWLLNQADFCPGSGGPARHRHVAPGGGQTLTHSHAGGHLDHGYFEHPEDGHR